MSEATIGQLRICEEAALLAEVAFLDHLVGVGVLTDAEATAVLATLAERRAGLIGTLFLRVRLDNRRV